MTISGPAAPGQVNGRLPYVVTGLLFAIAAFVVVPRVPETLPRPLRKVSLVFSIPTAHGL